jgi:glycosyltransferase involved in cell wall biosynthesis
MRIAQIAPLAEAVPPERYGGTERVVSYLTEELVALGHEVTLFASGDSTTSAQLVPAWPRATRLDPEIRDPLAPVFHMLERVYERAHEFDVLHFHLDYLPFRLFSAQPTPFLNTMHGRMDLPEARRSTRRIRTCRWSRSRTPSAARCRTRTGWRPCTTACPNDC